MGKNVVSSLLDLFFILFTNTEKHKAKRQFVNFKQNCFEVFLEYIYNIMHPKKYNSLIYARASKYLLKFELESKIFSNSSWSTHTSILLYNSMKRDTFSRGSQIRSKSCRAFSYCFLYYIFGFNFFSLIFINILMIFFLN